MLSAMFMFPFQTGQSKVMLKERDTPPHREYPPGTPESGPHEVPTVLFQDHGINKNQIYFHRSYRKLERHSLGYLAVMFLLQVGVVAFFIMYFYPEITLTIATITKSVLSSLVPEQLIDIVARPYIYDHVYIVTLPGRYPSLHLSIIVAIISLTFFFLAISFKKVIDPKLVWLIFIGFINLSAALYFIFFSGYFPYDMEIFSEMYIKTEVGIWVIIPFILTVALIPFPIRLRKKMAVILLTLSYSLVFACARYIVFLYFLRSTTYLFMALMFFMLGPFLDFIYIVASYSMCLSTSGKQTQKKLELWNWLY
ncbi:MAG: hypothetical protein GY940_14020 [bacterium]|nr:hypothetical protein [bacterium]